MFRYCVFRVTKDTLGMIDHCVNFCLKTLFYVFVDVGLHDFVY